MARQFKLIGPVDAEIYRVDEGCFLRAVFENSHGVPGNGAVMAGPFNRVIEGIVLVHQFDGMIQITVFLVELFKSTLPESAFVIVSPPERKNDRQGDLAFAEIVPDGFAEGGLFG